MKLEFSEDEKTVIFIMKQCRVIDSNRHINQACKGKFVHCWKHSLSETEFKIQVKEIIKRIPLKFDFIGDSYEDEN